MTEPNEPTEAPLRFLLLQLRNADDPMLPQEQATFQSALDCDAEQISYWNLLDGRPPKELLAANDIVLIGGSGHYSAADEGEWLETSLDALRNLYELKKPTFASCWGFQAMARALGGRTISDLDRAELGTPAVQLTDSGKSDPIFSPSGETFPVFQGHQDRVAELPPGAIHLASSKTAPYQAFTFADRPIYATQFHPELSRDFYLERIRAYPEYVEKITGQTFAEFESAVGEATESRGLLDRFVEMVRRNKSNGP